MSDATESAASVRLWGLPFAALGVVALLFPGVTADLLDRHPTTVSEAINLRSTWSGTLFGIGAAIATGRFTPTSVADAAAGLVARRLTPTVMLVACGLLWITLAVAVVRGIAFVVDGSPDALQWFYFWGELALAGGAAIYLRGR